MNDQPIVMSADLPHLVGALKAGSKAKLEIIRDGKRKNVDLTVGAIPEEGKELDALPKSGGVERSSNRLGVAVAELTDEQKKANDIKSGVVIKEVQDGPAALIGLQPGDVITHLNNQAIGSTKEFTEIAKALPKNRSVSMRVLRQGRASFITFKLAE
jgi:serine protease Do